MTRVFIAGLFFLCAATAGMAQTPPTRQVSLGFNEPPYVCGQGDTNLKSHVIDVPDYLPKPLYLVGIDIQLANSPHPPGAAGIISWYNDPWSRFRLTSNPPYPQSQNGDYHRLEWLHGTEVRNGWPLLASKDFLYPIEYDEERGDRLLIDLPCDGGHTLNVWYWIRVLDINIPPPPDLPPPPPPPEPGWGVVFSASTTEGHTATGGQTKRQVLSLAGLNIPSNAVTQGKVTLTGGPEGRQITNAYICQQAPSGDPYDCDGTPAPLLVDGQAGFTVPANGEIVATFTYAWPKQRGLVLPVYGDNPSADDARGASGLSNVAHYWKSGSNDAATIDTSGYGEVSGLLSGISKIEMDGF